MELEDKLKFIPHFEVCLCGSVIYECINSAVQFLGYSNASPEQFKAVYNFVQGRDVFVLLPTEMSMFAALGVDGLGEPLCIGVETVVLTGS